MKRWNPILFIPVCVVAVGVMVTATALAQSGVPDEDSTELVKPAERDPDQWGDALCNDGTPFAFTVQTSDTGSEDWVVHLQGGGLCDDSSAMCADRNRALTTTIPGEDGSPIASRNLSILSTDQAENPTFHDANLVAAYYCSSDLWSGASTERRPTSSDPEGWYFAGRTNVSAMFEVLIDEYGLDDTNPETQVLFAGSSAGGAGVIANADNIAQMLPQTAADDRLRLLNDGGFLAELTVLGERTAADTSSLRTAAMNTTYNFWGSALNPLCEQAQRDAGLSPGMCIVGSVSYPFIVDEAPDGLGLPYLVQEAAVDTSTMRRLGITEANRLAVRLLRETTVAALQEVAWVFSGGEAPYHTLLGGDRWLNGPEGATFRDLITRFWEGGTPEQVIWGNP